MKAILCYERVHLDSLGSTREAPGRSLCYEKAFKGNPAPREGSLGQPGRHQGGRKGLIGQPGRHQGGTREAEKD